MQHWAQCNHSLGCVSNQHHHRLHWHERSTQHTAQANVKRFNAVSYCSLRKKRTKRQSCRHTPAALSACSRWNRKKPPVGLERGRRGVGGCQHMEHTLPYQGIECVRSLPAGDPGENRSRAIQSLQGELEENSSIQECFLNQRPPPPPQPPSPGFSEAQTPPPLF